jgi:hypothetical protein
MERRKKKMLGTMAVGTMTMAQLVKKAEASLSLKCPFR